MASNNPALARFAKYEVTIVLDGGSTLAHFEDAGSVYASLIGHKNILEEGEFRRAGGDPVSGLIFIPAHSVEAAGIIRESVTHPLPYDANCDGDAPTDPEYPDYN